MEAQLTPWWETSWLILSILAVLASILIHGLIYALAHAFNLRELQNSSKAEIVQALATAILAISLVTIVGFISEYINDHIYGTVVCGGEVKNVNGIDSALVVVQCRIIEKARALEKIHQNLFEWARTKFNLFGSYLSLMGIPVFSGQYLSNLYRDIEELRFKMSLTVTFLIALNALITFVAYIKNTMITWFLPFGLLLRSFHFTRGIGSLFISIAVGFYFVFPYVFIITDPGFVKLPPPPEVPKLPGAEFCYPTMSSVLVMVSYEQQYSFALYTKEFDSSLGGIYASLIMHPLVAFFITIFIIRYLMYLFGEEGYDLMRMVSRSI